MHKPQYQNHPSLQRTRRRLSCAAITHLRVHQYRQTQRPSPIKPSPAEDALVEAAKDAQVQRKSLEVLEQQAEKAWNDKKKALDDKLAQLNKELGD